MGRFMKQLGAQGMGDVELTAEGDLAEFDLTFIRAAVIKGMLADVVSVRINLVNAGLMAEKRGMNLIERKKHQREFAYESLLTLRSTSGAQRWTVRGAVLQGEPHIVAINDLWVDFPATGHVLLAMHNDRPGMIGAVGTVLGNADVNISFMHVGRRAPRSEAIMALGTDEPTTPQLQATISAMPHIQWLKAITL
jgi:hypothetical protein